MVLYFADLLHTFSITEHPNKWTINEVRFNKRRSQNFDFLGLETFYCNLTIRGLGAKL